MNDIVAPPDFARAAIVAEARRWIGTPYTHQASVMGAGCDCLGLVRGVWRALFGAEPEPPHAYSADWAEAGNVEHLLLAGRRHFVEQPPGTWREGDVLLFRIKANVPAKHLGIATSRGTMVHAHDGAQVCEIDIGPFWNRRLSHAFSFPPANVSEPSR